MRRKRVDSELSTLRRQVQAAHGLMYAAASKAGARKLLSPDDIQEIRRISKPGAPRKVTSIQMGCGLLELYQKKTDEYAARVAAVRSPDDGAPSSGTGLCTSHSIETDTLTEDDSASGVSARAALPMEGEMGGRAESSVASRGARGRIAIDTIGETETGLLTRRSLMMEEVLAVEALTARYARPSAPERGAPRWVVGVERDPRLPDGAAVPLGADATNKMESKLRDYAIAVAVARGESARQALEKRGLTPTASRRRQAQRLGRKLLANAHIEDARPLRAGATRKVLTNEMRQAILAIAMRYPTANATGIQLGNL
ncbi:hypothetical protein [Gemmatimonas sp.]|uniref:hypothetical protein n=1 Tax=Gemmatimonas sp. TaxID=1962908 RepID=UPI003F6FE85E